MTVKYVIAGLCAVAVLAYAQVAVSANGQAVSTQDWTTNKPVSSCVSDVKFGLNGAGFKHVTSGRTHKDGSVVLFADAGAYQATVFCLNKHIAMEVTGPSASKATSLVDDFVQWYNVAAGYGF